MYFLNRFKKKPKFRKLGFRRVGLIQVDRIQAANITYCVYRERKEVEFVSPDGWNHATFSYSFKEHLMSNGEIAEQVFRANRVSLSDYYEDVRTYNQLAQFVN